MLQRVLMTLWNQRTSNRWVFANGAGNIDIHLLERLKRICRQAGIQPAASTVHALRHSFGTHLRASGVSLADIADLMGHKDLATTQIYAKVLQEHLRDAVSKLSPIVKPGHVLQLRSTEVGNRGGLKQLPANLGNTRQTTND
jgi:site-specific recombinase XerD